ncbi:MAG: DegT/DnrJ/EryC1/StrS family aminotransferase [Alphaproteobacteria bacterium]
MSPPLPFVNLAAQTKRLRGVLDAHIGAVLDHGRFILGPEVAELEAALVAFIGARHVVGVASGTVALQIALMADGIGRGDAVFLPAFTFTATAEAVLAVGAEPVFIDVDQATCLIDVDDLARGVETVKRAGRARPRAIIAVDLYGQPADYARLGPLARREGLVLVADGAQSCGASLDGRRVGALAPVTALSFFPSKPLGCFGDGGALVTDEEPRAALYRSIRAHGAGTSKYDIVRLGMNGRLDTLQAAVLLAKLTVFEDELRARERIAQRYDQALGGRVGLPGRRAGAASAWACYTIQVDRRDQVRARLAEVGIPTMVYYPAPMHLQPAFAAWGGGAGSLPMSEALAARVLSLPMHAYLDEATVDRITGAVLDALEQHPV